MCAQHNLGVSVLVPVYNVERYLPQCLDSLVSQTMQDIEFICLDDGSTDSCGSMLDDYAARDPRFVVVHKSNSGYGATMNEGLRRARGTYIGILESDDWANPDCFESLYALAEAYGFCDIVKANYYQFWEDGEVFVENFAESLCGRVLAPRGEDGRSVVSTVPSIWAALYRREFLESNGIDFVESPGASYQDTGFVMKSWIAAQSIVLTHDAFLHYRVGHAGSSSVSHAKVYCVCDEFASIDAFIKEHPITDSVFAKALAIKRYVTYRWNLGRLGWKDKREFLKATSGELARVGKEVGWDYSLISDVERRELERWIDDPERLYLDMRISSIRKEGSSLGALPYRLWRKAHVVWRKAHRPKK